MSMVYALVYTDHGDVIEDFEMEAVLRKLAIPKQETIRGAGGTVEKPMQT